MSENSIGSGADAVQSLLLLKTPVDRKSSTSSAAPPVVIKTADMKRDWQKEAVDLAISYGVEKDIVEQIKKEFENKYGPTWHCFVGKNFERFVDAAKEANSKAQADIEAKQTVVKGHRYKMVAKRKGLTSLSQREDEKKKVKLVAELGLFDVNDEEEDDDGPLRFSRSKKASRAVEQPPPPSTASPQAENPRFSTNAPNSTAPQQTTSYDQPHHAIIIQSEYEAPLHRIPTKFEHPLSQSTAPSQAENPRFPTKAPNSTPIAHSQPQHATLIQSQPASPIQTTSPQQKPTSITPSVDYLKTHSLNDPKIKIVNPSESVHDHVGGHDDKDKSSSGAEFVHSVHSPTNKDPPPPQQNQPLNPQNTNPQPHSSTPHTATHIPIFGLTSPSSNPASSIDINQVLIALQANQQQQLALQVQMVQLVASQQALQGQFDAFSTRLMAIINETLTKANLAVAMTNLEARVQELGDRVLANTSSKEYQSSRTEDLISRLTAVEQVVNEVAKEVTKKKIFKIVEDTASD